MSAAWTRYGAPACWHAPANSRATLPWGRWKARRPAILPQRRGPLNSSREVEEKRTGSRLTYGRLAALSGTVTYLVVAATLILVAACAAQSRPVSCVVRNISPSGEAIDVDNAAFVPERFRLVIARDFPVRECRVIWQRGAAATIRCKDFSDR